MPVAEDHHATPERRLAAILAADCVGFSRLLGADEAGTLAAWDRARRLIDPIVAERRGRVFKVMGDGLLAEFPSSWLALRAAVSIQDMLATAAPPRLILRIGLHQADVLVQGDDLIGDGVNVAARLEPLAPPGGICLSARVREDVAGRLDLPFVDGGERQLKNIARRHRVFFLLPPAESPLVTAPTSEAEETTVLAAVPARRFSLLVLSSATSGPEPGSVIPLHDRSLTIGRQSPSELLLPNGVVSRTHCTLDHLHGTTILSDLRSTNGTFVDGRRVDGPTALLPGALIRIGPFLLQYTADADA